ncbi:MAG: amino acid ABC transporter permease [Gammaproteobacteria bacterium]|nr:amino acid ABC transporter permease [Gammaproteobacteria bacterium]
MSLFLLQLVPGLLVTVEIFTFTLLIAIPLGVIFALGKISRFKIVVHIIDLYVWIMRGTPLMLQLIFFYFGAINIGLNLSRFVVVLVVFVLNYAAYFAEIFRAGIQAVDRSQYEGADVLGLSFWQTMRYIILPQAIKKILPPLANEIITLVKDTTLAQVVGVVELFATVKVTVIRDFVIYPFIIAALFYLMFTQIITKLVAVLERYYAHYE